MQESCDARRLFLTTFSCSGHTLQHGLLTYQVTCFQDFKGVDAIVNQLKLLVRNESIFCLPIIVTVVINFISVRSCFPGQML